MTLSIETARLEAVDLDELNRLGRDGWELYAVSGAGVAFLRRPSTGPVPDPRGRDRRRKLRGA